jgi:hypothetical protein
MKKNWIPDKAKILEKWKPILENDPTKSYNYKQFPQFPALKMSDGSTGTTSSEYYTILPIAAKIVVKTAGMDIVSVVETITPIINNDKIVGYILPGGKIEWTDKQYIRELKLKRLYKW